MLKCVILDGMFFNLEIIFSMFVRHDEVRNFLGPRGNP
jgi:hypothetical protein